VSEKTAPAGPLRDPLPPVYPIPLIEVACRALEMVSGLEEHLRRAFTDVEIKVIADIAQSSLRIIRDGLASHEHAAQEGRSRG